MNLHGPVRVAETAGSGTVLVKISFPAWAAGDVASSDHAVELLPAKPGPKPVAVAPQLVKTLVHPDRKGVVWTAQFSPDGSKLLTSGYPSGIIQLFDTNSWKEIRRIDTPPGLRSTAAYAVPTPDLQTLYVNFFRRKAGREEKDGKTQMRVDCSGEIRVYDLATGRQKSVIPASPDHGPN
ncbi:MAG: hypothetical protein ACJ8F7_10580 [Gemmataceae bacterium]